MKLDGWVCGRYGVSYMGGSDNSGRWEGQWGLEGSIEMSNGWWLGKNRRVLLRVPMECTGE